MAYTDWLKVQGRAKTLLRDENVDTLAPFITAAEAWLDTRLGTVYKLPLTVVDQIVKEIATAEAAALAVADLFAHRGRDEVTLTQDLHKWANDTVMFILENTSLTAQQIPRPAAEARPMVRSNTPLPSPMGSLLGDAFQYRGGPGWPRR